MAEYRRENYTGTPLPSVNVGDVFVGCMFAQDVEGTDIGLPNIAIKFDAGCNLRNVLIQSNWVVSADCATKQGTFPPAPTDEEVAEEKSANYARDLADIAQTFPAAVARGTKGQWKPDTMSAVMSADGDQVDVIDVGGKWK